MNRGSIMKPHAGLIVFIVAVLCGCTTPYQKTGATNGYSEPASKKMSSQSISGAMDTQAGSAPKTSRCYGALTLPLKMASSTLLSPIQTQTKRP